MGSFKYQISQHPDGRITFWLSNDTERASGSHFIGRYKPRYQGSLEELIDIYPELKTQTLESVVGKYNVISILKAKTRLETIGDEGGGRMEQTFTWTEKDVGC